MTLFGFDKRHLLDLFLLVCLIFWKRLALSKWRLEVEVNNLFCIFKIFELYI
jgi:hypothetical protein